ncbi:MAG: AbrB/MazE/SpoVT family DNA-binding domain-containing protein [Nanoarchaeota archaeon]
MKRKVMQVAQSSALISLPYKWVKEHNVRKGDELEVTPKGDSLLISTKGTALKRQAEVDVTGLDRTTIMYVIRSLYRLGYETVSLRFPKPLTTYIRKNEEISISSVVHTEINRLVGFEVMQEKENFCVIKDLQEASYKDFDIVLRRVFLIMQDAFEEYIDGVKKNNTTALESIENRHDTVTKFASHCLRLLNKKGEEVEKSDNYYHIIASLDRITDILKYSARDAIQHNARFSKSVVEILVIVKEAFVNFYKLFYNFDNKLILKINEQRYTVEKKLKEMKASNIEVITCTRHLTILEVLLDLIEARTALEYC